MNIANKSLLDDIIAIISNLKYIIILMCISIGIEDYTLLHYGKNIFYINELKLNWGITLRVIPFLFIGSFSALIIQHLITFMLALIHDNIPFLPKEEKYTERMNCFSTQDLFDYAMFSNPNVLSYYNNLILQRKTRNINRTLSFFLLIALLANLWLGWLYKAESFAILLYSKNNLTTLLGILMIAILFFTSIIKPLYDDDYKTDLKYPADYKVKDSLKLE